VSGSCIWLPIFIRDALVDDASLRSLLIKLNGISLGQSSLDPVRWDLNPKGSFTVKSFYMKLALCLLYLCIECWECVFHGRLFRNLWLHLECLCLFGRLPMTVF